MSVEYRITWTEDGSEQFKTLDTFMRAIRFANSVDERAERAICMIVEVIQLDSGVQVRTIREPQALVYNPDQNQ